VFQELKRYLTSPPIMVAPEPGEPLLLYIATTVEAVSMVLVAERPKLLLPQASKGVATSRSGSQNPGPAKEQREGEAVGSQKPEASPAPKPKVRSWPLEAISGPDDQEAAGSQLPKASLDPGGHKSLEPDPMEVDAPDPQGGSGLSNAWYTTSVKSSMMPR
jgi:hypothetical protein